MRTPLTMDEYLESRVDRRAVPPVRLLPRDRRRGRASWSRTAERARDLRARAGADLRGGVGAAGTRCSRTDAATSASTRGRRTRAAAVRDGRRRARRRRRRRALRRVHAAGAAAARGLRLRAEGRGGRARAPRATRARRHAAGQHRTAVTSPRATCTGSTTSPRPCSSCGATPASVRRPGAEVALVTGQPGLRRRHARRPLILRRAASEPSRASASRGRDRDSAEWWEALRRHELVIQRCDDCGAWRWPPRAICGECG